ncbi:MAG: hypothetical protein K5639_07935 [Eubacterium sp.]|nr:hypothetical protein [Eubacterium sp.]
MRKIILYNSDNIKTEVEWVLDSIWGMITSNGYKKSDFAVVCCDDNSLMTYRRQFLKRGLSLREPGEVILPDQPIVREVMKIIRIFRDPYDDEALRKIMWYFGRIESERIEMILWHARMKGVTPCDALQEYIDSLPTSSLRSEGRMLLRVLKKKHTGIESCMMLLVNCNFYRRLRMDGEDDPEGTKRYYLDRLMKTVRGFDEKYHKLDVSIGERIRRFESYLWDQSERQQKDSVLLTTINKPLERDYFIVFVMGAIEQTDFANQKRSLLNRRNLYETLQRSKMTPYVTYYKAKEMEGYYVPCKPSRIIDEIPESLKKWTL